MRGGFWALRLLQRSKQRTSLEKQTQSLTSTPHPGPLPAIAGRGGKAHAGTHFAHPRTSSTNEAGCSKAAKCPPFFGSFQYTSLDMQRSAQLRGAR